MLGHGELVAQEPLVVGIHSQSTVLRASSDDAYTIRRRTPYNQSKEQAFNMGSGDG